MPFLNVSIVRMSGDTGFMDSPTSMLPGRLHEVAPDIANGRVIIAHLGSGASMCALFEGRSVESTMGFTALDGLPMGTRPGQIDPGALIYVNEREGMSPPPRQSLGLDRRHLPRNTGSPKIRRAPAGFAVCCSGRTPPSADFR
jgi:hypothetical protein